MAAKRDRAIRFACDAQKAGELAARFAELGGGSMPMLKVLKLMYLADRTSLIETGFPITGDTVVAMDKGPVLSKTYDHLKPAGTLTGVRSEPGNVALDPVGPWLSTWVGSRLSEYEREIATRIFQEFGHLNGDQLIAHLHRSAPEWKPPPRKTTDHGLSARLAVSQTPPTPLSAISEPMTGSSALIDPAAILRAAGKSEDEIAEIGDQADYFLSVRRQPR